MAINMKKNLYVFLSIALGVISCSFLAGCGSEVQTVQAPTNAAPPKGSFPDAVKNNPNIPEAAKKAMMGSGGRPPGAK